MLLLFCSEPHAQDYGDSLGYTEVDAFRMLLEVLEDMPSEPWRLLVRLHPTEQPESLSREIAQHTVRVEFAADMPPRDLMIASDVVIGMLSMFLIEAALLGCHTISLQPGMKIDDFFIGKRLGLTTAVYTANALLSALFEGDISDDWDRRKAKAVRLWPRLHLDGQAAERVAEIVNRCL